MTTKTRIDRGIALARGDARYVAWLEQTLIPDLKVSQPSLAEDFEQCVAIIRKLAAKGGAR